MKERFGLTPIPRFIAIAYMLLIFGCEDSGYNMPEPYVISGTVSTGNLVSGIVNLRTNKRWDYYSSEIKNNGTYEINIWKHDPPYLIWAEIDSGNTLLYSYTSGNRHKKPESNEEHDEDNTVEVSDAIVNITPLTDLVMGLAIASQPEVFYSENPMAGPPGGSDIESKQDVIETLFEEVFISMGFEGGFNLFHRKFDAGVDGFDDLLGILKITYETHVRIKLSASDDSIIYHYDIGTDEEIEKMESEDVGELISALLKLAGE